MKKTIIFLSVIAALSIWTGCNDDPAGLDASGQYYNTLCASSNGSINVEIDGKSWGTGCAVATLSDYGFGTDSLLLSVWGYSIDGALTTLGSGHFEWFFFSVWLTKGEATYDQPDDEIGAVFYAGEYDKGLQNLTPIQIYSSDSDTYPDKVKVTSINGNHIKGNFSFTGVDDEDGQTVLMKGTFDVIPE